MVTHGGDNVFVGAVRGNFDDTQTAIKRVFGDAASQKRCRSASETFLGHPSTGEAPAPDRVLFWAYASLVGKGAVSPGREVNFVVPTGNFGNILAGYYAKRMGPPVRRLVCASNANNVLTDFFSLGRYDAKRLFRTISPSMDILISSNLERLLFEIAQRDGGRGLRLDARA